MRFAVLDGWRGVCALTVALHHFHADGHFFALPFVRGAWMFVDFFFVLSGFVIAHAYGPTLSAPGNWFAFAMRRLGRLWPLHAAVLAALVVLEGAKAAAMLGLGIGAANPPFHGETGIGAIATNLLLIHALGIHDGATWNFPSWSISAEFWTYLLFAALAAAGIGRSRPAAAAVSAGAALVVAAFGDEWLHAIADLGFFRCVFGFFLGVLVHGLIKDVVTRPLPGATWLEAAAVVLVVAFASHTAKGDPWSMAAPPVFAAAVAVFAFERGALSRLLATRPARALGDWSYSIYLVHTLVLVAIGRAASLAESVGGLALSVPHEVNGEMRVLLTFGAPWIADLAALAYLAVVVALAAWTWKRIERPCQHWTNARFPLQRTPEKVRAGWKPARSVEGP